MCNSSHRTVPGVSLCFFMSTQPASEHTASASPLIRPAPSATPEEASEIDSSRDGAGHDTTPVRSSLAYRLGYPWIRLLLGVLTHLLSPRLRVTGRYHMPRRGAVILTPNHLSNADPAYLSHASPRALWFMAKEELFDMGIAGSLMRYWQSFSVDPGGADRAALRYAERLLQAGQGLVIFPEGRCSPDGEMLPILPGAVLLALRTGAPVVPIGLSGTNGIIPFGSHLPRPTPSPVRIHFASPIHFDDITALPRREQREAATRRLEKAMQAARAMAQRCAPE
jgi:1-acyl-sn-glycerol-3-phosphate acyltransferase